jgi:4-diphosphocytidyl-2C-methyl-D-erythritol 2-phosphate synthase
MSDEKKLFAVAKKLGSDVSACLLSQPLCLFNDGSSFLKIQRSKLKSSELYQPGFLLINSNKPLKTKDVFDNFNISRKSKTSNHKNLPLNSLSDYLKVISLGNDLIYSANTLAPEINIILERLKKISGCLGQTMSGSGGTCFGLFKSIKKAKQTHQFIIDNCLFENYWIWSGGILEN